MEHRCGPRKPVDLEVVIHSRTGAVRGRAVELSEGGMFVVLSPPTSAQLSGAVEVTVTLPGNVNGASHRLPALVVQVQPNGVGLMFIRVEGKVARLLAAVTKSEILAVAAVVAGTAAAE